jgi:hypothetical protein
MQVNKKKVETVIEDRSGNRYVVMRNGTRVSDEEYSSEADAMAEYEHWNRVITRWPDGSKLEIVNLSRKGK